MKASQSFSIIFCLKSSDSNAPLSTYTPLPLVDGTYYWRVKSIDEAGNESDFSSTDNFTVDTAFPGVPTLIPYSPDPTNNKTPTLDWIDVTGAVEYNILTGDNPEFTNPVVDAIVSASTFTPSPLNDGTYHWKVKSIDKAGNESDFSSPDSFTINSVVPGVPTLIHYIPDPTNNKIPTLDWSDVSGAAKYHLQIDDDPDFSNPEVDDNNVLASTYTPSLEADGTYYWRVSSISEAGDESYFSSVDSFILDTVASEIPILVTYTPDPTNNNMPTLDWDDIVGAIKYHIQIDDDPDFSSPAIDDSDVLVSDYTPTSGLSDGTYYWRVSSIDEPGNESNFSEADVFTVDTTAPAAPTLVPHPDPTNDKTPTLDWNEVTGAIKHHIQIDDNSNFSSPVVDDSDVSVSIYTPPPSALTNGTYYWRVSNIDSAGNESDFSSADSFTVDVSSPSANTVNPGNGSIIIESTQIVITFNESMDISALSLGGTMALEDDGGVWSTNSYTNDRLTISATNTWTGGSGKTLTIDVEDIAGNPISMALNLSYDILNGIVYVRDSDGNNANPGTTDLPKKTIQAAINLADSLYTTAKVHVAEGTYNVSYQSGTHVVMKEGISIYGGYSLSNWNNKDPNTYTTTIQDTSTSGVINQAIAMGGNVTLATIIDGFTINGGGGTVSYAIYTTDSPTIQNNIINGGNGSNGSGGIYNFGSPTIQNNTINGGSAGNSSYGIISDQSTFPIIRNNTINAGSGINSSFAVITYGSATIENNTINGGSGSIISSYGIIVETGSAAAIRNNTINGGSGGSLSRSISVAGTPTIENNIIFTSGGPNRYCIYEENSSNDPVSVRNNDFFDCPTAIYRDADGNCSGGMNCTLVEMESLTDMIVSGNISAVPDFVNQVGGNWHLQASSPINVRKGGLDGSTEGWGFTTDKDGNTRTAIISGSPSPTNPGAAGWSMGAFEGD